MKYEIKLENDAGEMVTMEGNAFDWSTVAEKFYLALVGAGFVLSAKDMQDYYEGLSYSYGDSLSNNGPTQ
jgi:uncharacterized protein Veg